MDDETYADTGVSSQDTDKSTTTSILQNSNKSFINRTWRPMMAWVYMAIIVFDFIIFPIMWSSLQAYQGILITTAWDPITLKSGGFFHIAMGAVLGITAYGRTKEKLEGRDESYNS